MTKVLSDIGARYVRPLNVKGGKYTDNDLNMIGFGISPKAEIAMMDAMDSLTAPITTPSVGVPGQFLQHMLSGSVLVATSPRKIDEFVGIVTAGDWSQEEVIQRALEYTGGTVPYADYQAPSLAGYNVNFERRTIVRFENSMRVGQLEEARASAIGENSAANSRAAATLALDIKRNSVGFVGFNSGNNRTYGFLNDPGLSAYVTVATGAASSTTWALKTFKERQADITEAFGALVTQSGGIISTSDNITIAIPHTHQGYFGEVNDYGISLTSWLKTAYPNARVINAPQLENANGAAEVFYMYAENVNDGSTDDGAVWAQVVPAKFRVQGAAKLSKYYEESYTNATAGAMCKRPWGVIRRSGI